MFALKPFEHLGPLGISCRKVAFAHNTPTAIVAPGAQRVDAHQLERYSFHLADARTCTEGGYSIS